MNNNHGVQAGLNRREFLLGLGAAALVIAWGCATFRRGSELDAAFADLNALLNQASGADTGQLASIAKRIRAESLKMVDAHETFVKTFNDKASSRLVTGKDLQEQVDDYALHRQSLLNDLLYLQDELHAALPPDAWPDVLEVLNRKSQAIDGRKSVGA